MVVIWRHAFRSAMQTCLLIGALLCATALGMPRSSPAQIPGRAGVGVKSGATMSTLRPRVGNMTNRTSFVAGVYGQAPISQYLTIQPEVLYVRKGASNDGFQLRIDYVEVPMLLKASFPLDRHFIPSVYAGPYASLAVRREVRELDRFEKAEDNFKVADYGVSLGVSIGMLISGYSAELAVRYDVGLPDVSKGAVYFDDGEPVSVRTNTFMVTLGISI